MTTSRACLLVVALIALCACGAARASTPACPQTITPETAQRIFDRLRTTPLGPDYRFEGVATAEDLVVRWSRGERPCPSIHVGFAECSSPTSPARLQVRVPTELAAECPGLLQIVTEIEDVIAHDETAMPRPDPRLSSAALLAIGLVVAAALVIRHLLASDTRTIFGWEDVGRIVFVAAAAHPFFSNHAFAVNAELATAWILFSLLLIDRTLVPAESTAIRLSLLGLFVFSLLLHWSLSSGGPGDLQLNLAAIWSAECDHRWGPAPIALFRLLDLVVGGIRDTQIVWCNLILSSLIPILLYGIVVGLGVGEVGALAAAFVAAAHPLLIVFSGVLERQPTYLFAACGSLLALVGFLERGGSTRFVVFIVGSVLAITSRPEGAHVLLLDLAILLVAPGQRRERTVVTLALAILAALAFGYVRHTLAVRPGDAGMHAYSDEPALLWTVLLDPAFTPLAWIVAWVIGLAVGLRRRAAWVALIGMVGLHVAWKWTGIYDQFVGIERQVASARYESILLVPFTIGIALVFDSVREKPRWLRLSLAAVFVGLSVATFSRPYQTLLRPFTIDYEYRFLKQHAMTLPAASRIYILDSPNDDDGFYNAKQIAPFVGSPVQFANWRERRCEDLQRGAADAYLYIGSFCAEQVGILGRPLPPVEHQQWMEDCAVMRARLAASVVQEIEVPARKMAWHDFKERTVRLGLYRIPDPALCGLGPPADG